jgi:hypothetical protein
MDYLSLLLGTPGRGWVEAALLLGLFWAALGHPDRIRRPWELRLSALLLAAAVAVPPVIQLAYLSQRPNSAGRQMGSEGTEWFLYASAVAPVLLMLAILLGVDAVLPRGGRARAGV